MIDVGEVASALATPWNNWPLAVFQIWEARRC